MNIPDLKSMLYDRRRTGITVSRLQRVKREGSPTYRWTPAVIASGASEVIEVGNQFPDSRKYEPLDAIEVVNNESTNNITLTINGVDSWYIPASTIRTIHGDGVALWHLEITNDGAANTTQGLIVVTLQKEPLTQDKWIRRHG